MVWVSIPSDLQVPKMRYEYLVGENGTPHLLGIKEGTRRKWVEIWQRFKTLMPNLVSFLFLKIWIISSIFKSKPTIDHAIVYEPCYKWGLCTSNDMNDGVSFFILKTKLVLISVRQILGSLITKSSKYCNAWKNCGGNIRLSQPIPLSPLYKRHSHNLPYLSV